MNGILSSMEQTEITANTGSYRNPNGTFAKGNPGKPKGAISFATKWERMIEKIAELDGISPDQVEMELVKVGYKRAKDGDYSFYRDAMDRIHGKPKESIDHNVSGGLTISFDSSFNDNNTN